MISIHANIWYTDENYKYVVLKVLSGTYPENVDITYECALIYLVTGTCKELVRTHVPHAQKDFKQRVSVVGTCVYSAPGAPAAQP